MIPASCAGRPDWFEAMKFYYDLFMVFFRIGLFTLGGGYAMLPLIEREVVDKKKWIEGEDFLNVLAIAQSLPGPIAVNTAVFVGYKTRGLAGSLVGLFGTVMPSFICMIIIASFFVGIKDDPTVAAVFTGIRPAVAALIAASVWSLGKKAKLTWFTGGVALASALAVWLARLSPAWVVVALALVGALWVRGGDGKKGGAEEEEKVSDAAATKDATAAEGGAEG